MATSSASSAVTLASATTPARPRRRNASGRTPPIYCPTDMPASLIKPSWSSAPPFASPKIRAAYYVPSKKIASPANRGCKTKSPSSAQKKTCRTKSLRQVSFGSAVKFSFNNAQVVDYSADYGNFPAARWKRGKVWRIVSRAKCAKNSASRCASAVKSSPWTTPIPIFPSRFTLLTAPTFQDA